MSLVIDSQRVKNLLALAESKGRLKAELAHIEKQIAGVLAAKEAALASAAQKASGRVPRAQRGALKVRVLEALKKAGSEGVAVKTLAPALGIKTQNLHAWFHTTGMKIKGLQHNGPGRWMLSK